MPTPLATESRQECTLQHLCTRSIEPARRFEAWRTQAHRLVDLAPPPPGTSLDAELVTLDGASCSFGAAQSSSYTTRADPRHHPEAADKVIMTFIMTGEVRVQDVHDRRRRIAPGTLALYDVTQAARYEWIGPSCEAYLVLPRAEALRALARRDSHGLATPLDQCALAPALRSQLTALARLALTLSPQERAGMLMGTRALALLALNQAGSAVSNGDDDALDELSAGRRAAALHCMASRLHETSLGADDIARAIGTSRTRLYAAFTAHGETVMGALRELRLQRARTTLDEGHRPHLGALAWRCGFADPSSFSRAFKARFGLSPAAWAQRAQVRYLSPDICFPQDAAPPTSLRAGD